MVLMCESAGGEASRAAGKALQALKQCEEWLEGERWGGGKTFGPETILKHGSRRHCQE